MTRHIYTFPKWQPEYEAAVLEADPSKVAQRVREAKIAIEKRFTRIENGHEHKAERKAIYLASHVLDGLENQLLRSLKSTRSRAKLRRGPHKAFDNAGSTDDRSPKSV